MNEITIPDLFLFFDESGKQKSDPIQLMGAMSVPSQLYLHKSFQHIHHLNNEYTFHWVDYNGYSKDREGIEKLMDYFLPIADFAQLIIIRYLKSDVELRAQKYTDGFNTKMILVNDTIYSKLPERICYGLLRGYGKHKHITASVYIEDATEYRQKHLAEQMKHSLNIHSLYRGEAFNIVSCEYRTKGNEIGVEMIDMILGMIGIILQNPKDPSSKKRAKVNLVLKLLKYNKLQPFLKNLKVFELDHTNQLKESNIMASTKLFIAQNYHSYNLM